ncbi:MAG: hypothetical protein Q7S03_00970 [bacterium]|nr:hypothetical protein [bacterium]
MSDKERQNSISNCQWQVLERPGYMGKNKDEQTEIWNQRYGEGNWKIAWRLANGQSFDYEGIFWQIYVAGYVQYFLRHLQEARFLSANYSYSFDKDFVSRQTAFDPQALYNKEGFANQFHHVALNIALEWFLGLSFCGKEPIQIREGKTGTPQHLWPAGWRWSPGRIPTVKADLIPENDIEGWWQKGSIEEVYQKSKILLAKI